MSQIIAWKCEETGKIFEVKKSYQTHIRRLSTARRKKVKAEEIARNRIAIFTTFRNTCRSAEQIVEFVKENWGHFCLNAVVNNRWGRPNRTPKSYPTLNKMTLEFVYSKEVSISHAAPLGTPTNWGGRVKTLPTSMPGWKGQIKYQPSDTKTSTYPNGSEMWIGTGLMTGSGGYASGYYYGTEMFEADWPALTETYNCARTYQLLVGTTVSIDLIAKQFDTAEKCKEFLTKFPSNVIEQAKAWKTLSGVHKSLLDIIVEELVCG